METTLAALTLSPQFGVLGFHFVVGFELLQVELGETGTAVFTDDRVVLAETRSAA